MAPQGSRAPLEFGGPLGNGAKKGGPGARGFSKGNWRGELRAGWGGIGGL